VAVVKLEATMYPDEPVYSSGSHDEIKNLSPQPPVSLRASGWRTPSSSLPLPPPSFPSPISLLPPNVVNEGVGYL
jgi:hypothetical protein